MQTRKNVPVDGRRIQLPSKIPFVERKQPNRTPDGGGGGGGRGGGATVGAAGGGGGAVVAPATGGGGVVAAAGGGGGAVVAPATVVAAAGGGGGAVVAPATVVAAAGGGGGGGNLPAEFVMGVKPSREGKTGSAMNLPEEARVSRLRKPTPIMSRPRVKVMQNRTDDTPFKYSIPRLLSVYENARDKNPPAVDKPVETVVGNRSRPNLSAREQFKRMDALSVVPKVDNHPRKPANALKLERYVTRRGSPITANKSKIGFGVEGKESLPKAAAVGGFVRGSQPPPPPPPSTATSATKPHGAELPFRRGIPRRKIASKTKLGDKPAESLAKDRGKKVMIEEPVKQPVPKPRRELEGKKLKDGQEVTAINQIVAARSSGSDSDRSVNVVNTFLSTYVENMKGLAATDESRAVVEENSGSSVIPVCSKRGVGNIPTQDFPGSLRADRPPETKSDLIIMLRRRNSEPYAPRSYLLPYPGSEIGGSINGLSPGMINVNYESMENYYFVHPGPLPSTKPYWEVSLFKTNRSMSVLSPGGHLRRALIEPEPTPNILQGEFGNRGPRILERPANPDSWAGCQSVSSRGLQPWLPDLPPNVTAENQLARFLTRERKYGERSVEPLRIAGRDHSAEFRSKCHAKRKSSTGNLIEHCCRRKERRQVTEPRPSFVKRHAVATILSILLLLLTGGIFLFMGYLPDTPSFFNLAPPIPGLVRGV